MTLFSGPILLWRAFPLRPPLTFYYTVSKIVVKMVW
jgi:hypothetical protein